MKLSEIHLTQIQPYYWLCCLLFWTNMWVLTKKATTGQKDNIKLDFLVMWSQVETGFQCFFVVLSFPVYSLLYGEMWQ